MRVFVIALSLTLAMGTPAFAQGEATAASGSPMAPFGRVLVRTLRPPAGVILRSATYTPSGRVLISYAKTPDQDRRELDLATMDDDGGNFRPVWSGALPERPKDNGIRYMVFPDNRRVFLGDFILECRGSLDSCASPQVLPVDYPAEIDSGPDIGSRWSEMIVAPDNRHVGWDTLFAGNRGEAVFTGTLQRTADRYRIVKSDIVSTLVPFRPDPRHRDGVIPAPVRGGEVKQFVHGGSAISVVGSGRRDIPDSVVQNLTSGRVEIITDAPGYDETTIFSPDERLGLTMTSRFSPGSDLAVLGLIPRPYPGALDMGLSMFAYTHSVTGVRVARPGNVGPALIDIAASKARPGYLGQNLNADPDWVFYSPMSWHPGGKKGMWIEGHRGDHSRRIRIVELPDYRPGPAVAARPTPDRVPYGSNDLSRLGKLVAATGDVDVKVYGRASGYIRYHRSRSTTEKIYTDFSDDGRAVFTGSEKSTINPNGQSVYTADVHVAGPKSGVMAVQMTFGPLRSALPAELVFAPDESGKPATRGFADYDGQRRDVSTLVP